MTFLSKLGGIVLKGIAIANGYGPLAAGLFPKAAPVIAEVSSELQQAAQIVVTAEAMGQALNVKGPEKATAAAPLMMQLLIQGLVAGKQGAKIHDQTLALQGARKMGEGMADFLNSLHEDGAKEA